MARLIDDLLSLSRIELNEHLRPDKELDLVGIVRQVADGLQTLARDRGVEIEVNRAPGPVVVLGNRDELIRVFETSARERPEIRCLGQTGCTHAIAWRARKRATRHPRRYNVTSVPVSRPSTCRDSTERLLSRRCRQEPDSGRHGLGLALVKHILNRHGGRLVIASTLGHGATFTASFRPKIPQKRRLHSKINDYFVI